MDLLFSKSLNREYQKSTTSHSNSSDRNNIQGDQIKGVTLN